MSEIYREGKKYFDQKDYAKAYEIFSQGDREGDIFCSFDLAQLLVKGLGIDKDEKRANEIFGHIFPVLKSKAEEGDAIAQSMVGAAYFNGYANGIGVEQSIVDAMYWDNKYVDCLFPLAENGDMAAQRWLGYAYQWGFGEQSFQKAEYWYKKASAQGDEYAKLCLAEIYRDGALGHRETQKAITLFQELKNFSEIGEIYAYGKGVEIDFERAEFWYKKAVEAGEAQACFMLPKLYFENGKSDKYKESIRLLESITEDEIWGSSACAELANCYREGLGVEQNTEKSKEFDRKGFELQKKLPGGVPYNYFFGLGTRKNYKKAFKDFFKFPNYAENQFYIGLCFAEGKGVKKDIALAKEWYEKAARQGEVKAILALGEMYYFGRGIDQDYEKAVRLFERSAEVRSYGEPNYYLGDCYHHGLGVKSDWHKAKSYYEKAIDLGYSCGYALEMVRIDLGEFRQTTEMEKYAREVAKLNLSGEALKERIVQDLKKDFGDSWEYLKENAKIGLTTGVLTYITFVSMGDEFCNQLDFSAVIVNFAKALEIELAEYFYKGYILYLKKRVSPAVFPADSVLLKIVKEQNEEIGREYQDENEIKNFKLGGLRYIIDDKFEILPSLEIAMQLDNSLRGRSVAYRRHKSRGSYGIRTIDKHMASYANELFDKSAFNTSNRKKEIVNYLIDLSCSVGELAFQYRNPAAHGDIMAMQKASACGDYIIKVRKLIYGFLSKIKKKYRNGYIVNPAN